MQKSIQPFFIYAIKGLLFLTAFVPLAFASKGFFPFILGKMLLFRGAVEGALVAALLYVAYSLVAEGGAGLDSLFSRFKTMRRLLLHPISLALAVFFISLLLSTLFAENYYRAFWGDIERAEGFFGLLHFGIFLSLSLLFFEKRDWISYFRISLVTGFVLVFYAALQVLGVTRFPFALVPKSRPDSFIGNPAFLGTHMIFLMLYAFIVFRSSSQKGFWHYAALVFMPVAFWGVFITNTRGTLLGFAAGLFFLLCYFAAKKTNLEIYKVNMRGLATFLLVALIAFSGFFWLTRTSSFWSGIPGLNRLARTAVLDTSDPSTQTRIITWKVSWEAFKDRPLLGWGPDNYLMAWEAHYDPDYALYGETWIDRAHNKLFDVLVMQGAIGFLSYLGLWGAIFYTIFVRKIKHIQDSSRVPLEPLLAAGLFAYFVQNLVLFDQIISYLALFGILGFLVVFYSEEPSMQKTENEKRGTIGFWERVGAILAILLVPVVLYFLYALGYVPYAQAKAMKESPALGNVDKIVQKLNEALYPYNYAQYTIRSQGLELIYRDQYFFNDSYRQDERFKSLGDLWLKVLDEFIEREPYDARVLIRVVEIYDVLGRDNEEYFKKAEKVLRTALSRSPGRQELYYHLALNLAKQSRVDEGLEYAKKAVELSPNVARAHYHYGLILAAAQRNDEAIKELAKAEELKPTFDGFFPSDFNTILLLYGSFGRNDKVAGLVLGCIDGKISQNPDRKYQELALYYFLLQRNSENFIKVAKFLGGNPELKEDMDTLIDLAKNGKWGIIQNSIIEK